ncbi:hypothetical protein IFM89_000100 [Coptis chinensis]|uniref:Uncharacterized protein n=1 Tax=Coptis chinensis TaxID=261450 RepID=A0A835I2A8_9MAGN|nr:hypothetical protein IFM89_000100 [Coptis chinensis]
MESQIISNDQILNKVNDIIKKQAAEVQELKKAVNEKKQELKELANLRKIEKDKLQVVEAKLKNQTVEWLSAQEELKCLTEEAHRHMDATSEALEDFKRVKMLLTDVRSELVSSQKSLAFSWRKMEEHEHQLEKQLGELEVQKLVMIAYTERLSDAESEVKNEHAKLRVAVARNIELEQDLSLEKELIEQLQEELNKEKSSLKQTTRELTLFQNELDQRTYEFKEAQNLLQVKESELVEARLQIQHLHSELASIKLLLEEKDSDLFDAQKKLSDLSGETAQLEELLSSREEQLTKSSKLLQEKDEHVHRIQHELDDTKLKFLEAATVVERLTKLTDQLVDSLKDQRIMP